jgi:hypothetical protein
MEIALFSDYERWEFHVSMDFVGDDAIAKSKG